MARLFDDASPHLDRFGLLLIISAATIAALSLADPEDLGSSLAATWASATATLAVGVTLLLAMRASGVARPWRVAADAAVGVTFGAVLVIAIADTVLAGDPLVGDLRLTGSTPAAVVVLAAFAPAVIVRRLLQHREVTHRTLFGGIAAYLLIAIAYYYAFLTVDLLQIEPFFGDPQPTSSFMYFSLSTVSTVGYGDLSAETQLGRLLATSEAVVGQVYLVTLVGMLVGLYAQRWLAGRLKEDPRRDTEDAAD